MNQIECSPIWDFDEHNFRGELEEVANGYKESTTTSFVDVNFFDFFDLSHSKIPQQSRISVSRKAFNLTLTNQLQSIQTAQQVIPSVLEMNIHNIVEEDSNNSVDAPSPVETTPKKKEIIKKSSSLSMKLGMIPQDDSKMRSPTSKTMEPISPINPQSGKKRKRSVLKSEKLEDSDYMNSYEDSLSSPTDESNLQKKRRKNNAVTEGGQSECCVKDCHGSVTNRLRFSLRGTNDEDFKPDFLKKEWQKICSKCYFRNFYKNKKR